MIRLGMKTYNIILIEKQQKISTLLSGKTEKYPKEILPYNQSQVIEQAKFTYFILQKVFEKQTKAIQDQGTKEVLQSLNTNYQLKSIKH